ncbi:RNA polymerase I associated factor [Chloropicon primus]|uniref:Uncharacterized protein n=2 Tax=Chloropicon primus TaxID=1764295 RepID=A0A5B8ML22_9CHLO|nr:hypothetical protein A3770_05p36710 [Chloropicon primus]UPR00367.1 RNA polymerase I associated factor [Chloropicon primus]|eukprot:QDZ21153.1 hypothetical protein A3770_05p36710 [Chloropicon primus]
MGTGVRVKVVDLGEEKKVAKNGAYACAPIVATFPQSVERFQERSGGLKAELYASKDHLQRKEFYVLAKGNESGGGLQYVGSSLDSSLGRPVRYLVGYLDKKTSTLEFVKPLHHATVAHMRVYRGKDDVLNKGTEGESNASKMDYSALESRRNLLKEFGSNKIKRVIAKRERTQLKDASSLFLEDQDTVLDWARKKADSSMRKGMNEKEQLAHLTESRRSVLPFYNLKATTASEAYPLGKFVSAAAWQALKSTQYYRDVSEGAETCDVYVLNRHSRLNAEGSSERESVLKALCLYAVLKWLHTSHSRSIRCRLGQGVGALAQQLELPQEFVQEMVLKFFKEGSQGDSKFSSWECSKEGRISLKLHLILLLLILEDFDVGAPTLAEEIGVPAQEVKSLAKELGCDLSGDKVKLLKRKRTSESGGATIVDLESKLPRIQIKRARAR